MGAVTESAVPTETLETIARSFFKAAVGYGFRQLDYIRFVNLLLDMSLKNDAVRSGDGTRPTPTVPRATAGLPLQEDDLAIRTYDPSCDRVFFDRWADTTGRLFLLSRTTAPPDRSGSSPHERRQRRRCHHGARRQADRTHGVPRPRPDAEEKAELRKLIGDPQERGKGYGKHATALWLGYGISCLGLQKIYLNTLETDLQNIRLNEDLGFKVEGILRNECWFDGGYHDILRMALLAD